GARLEYQKGPDGVSYAVAGEVSIDTSQIPGDPQATVAKMRQVQRAALAPASPSNQDIKVASNAGALASKAMSEMIVLQSKERIEANENKAFGALSARQAADSYSKVSSMAIEPQTSQFKIAV
ncbi:MAG: SprA-related family protein, partial [Desulfamplus sp.]|nr:SprA-related family protein [Desulfamplus sp.]